MPTTDLRQSCLVLCSSGYLLIITVVEAAFPQHLGKRVGGPHGQNSLSEARELSKPRPLKARTTTEILQQDCLQWPPVSLWHA